jgi:hypothetical protein
MSRALVIGGLAFVVLAAAGGAYFFLKKGGADHRADPGEHVAAPDGTAAGETVKDTLGTDEGGGIADDASSAVDAVDEGGETVDGETPEGANSDVFGDSEGAAMHDEEPHVEEAEEPETPGQPN